MRILVAGLFTAGFCLASAAPTWAVQCANNPNALGVSRTIEVDTTGGPRFGSLQYGPTLGLKDKEVVLTFDDGPHRTNTMRVLDALEKHCVKATFFPIGIEAKLRSGLLLRVAAKGHRCPLHSFAILL